MSEEVNASYYDLKFKCENCNHVWIEQITKGYRVCVVRGVAKILEDSQSEETLSPKVIKCPHCLCSKDIKRDFSMEVPK